MNPDGQHENGLCEAMIKILKKTINPEVENGNWNVLELETLFSSALRLVNSRLLSFTSATEDLEDANAITPIMCMQPHREMARHMSVDAAATLCKRAAAITSSEAAMWRKFEVASLPTRCMPRRWCTSRGEMPNVGDVVMIMDTNMVRNKWKLARVVAVKKSKDDVCRSIQVEYSREGTKTLVWRSVRSVSLIVRNV